MQWAGARCGAKTAASAPTEVVGHRGLHRRHARKSSWAGSFTHDVDDMVGLNSIPHKSLSSIIGELQAPRPYETAANSKPFRLFLRRWGRVSSPLGKRAANHGKQDGILVRSLGGSAPIILLLFAESLTPPSPVGFASTPPAIGHVASSRIRLMCMPGCQAVPRSRLARRGPWANCEALSAVTWLHGARPCSPPVDARDRGPVCLPCVDRSAVRSSELSLGAKAAPDDWLGSSVAISNNGRTVLIGAPLRTVDGAVYAGTAIAVRFSDGRWSSPKVLNLRRQAGAYDGFGTSVALSASGNTAIVGAPGRTVDGQNYAGAVGVFTFAGANWSRPTELNLGPRAFGGDSFGASVALSDNGSTMLVGAPGRSVEGKASAGAGEVFTFNGRTWTLAAELSLAGRAASGNWLGSAVSLNRDGRTALIGAPLRTVDGRRSAGTVEVFTSDGRRWSGPEGLSLGAGARAQDQVGWSVSLDGRGDVALAGAPGRAVRGRQSAGAAEVFRFRTRKWRQSQQLTLAKNAEAGDHLGFSVNLSEGGDIALVGDPSRSVARVQDAGAAELFRFHRRRWGGPTQLTLAASRIGPEQVGFVGGHRWRCRRCCRGSASTCC